MDNVGLVLEGGGMRGVYTCGVLDYFMEKDLYFNYIIGVSAGACNAASYISKQRGRNEKVSINYTTDPRYMGLNNLIKSKSFFNMDFIFDEVPNKLVMFDYDTFYKSACKFLIGATDCETGQPYYFEKEDFDEKLNVLRATASLPLISPIVKFKNHEFLDGGISDSIPIKKSISDGNLKNIVVLTRNEGYRKKPIKYIGLIKAKYKKYPLLVQAILNRYKKYNDTMDYIEKLEGEGKVIIIRPSKPLNVGRLEKNQEKLKALFYNGYDDAKTSYDKIINFI